MKSFSTHHISSRPHIRCRSVNQFPVVCRSSPIYDHDDKLRDTTQSRRSLLGAISLIGSSSYLTPQNSFAIDSINDIPAAQFTSSEGFSFSYPGNGSWVVAFDRSGGRGDGAVTSVGDFTRLLVVGVFRTRLTDPVTLLDEPTGNKLCIQPQLEDLSTMRFKQVKSVSSDDNRVYDFEYVVEVCRGEIQEGAGGVLRCLSPINGQSIPTQIRHHLGRAVLSKDSKTLFTMMATTPEERWPEVEGLMNEIVQSFASC